MPMPLLSEPMPMALHWADSRVPEVCVFLCSGVIEYNEEISMNPQWLVLTKLLLWWRWWSSSHGVLNHHKLTISKQHMSTRYGMWSVPSAEIWLPKAGNKWTAGNLCFSFYIWGGMESALFHSHMKSLWENRIKHVSPLCNWLMFGEINCDK